MESPADTAPPRKTQPNPARRKSVAFLGFQKVGKKVVCTSIVIPGQGKVDTGLEVSGKFPGFPDPHGSRQNGFRRSHLRRPASMTADADDEL